jgi:hypothetical protein
MKGFALSTFTKARVLDVRTLARKDRKPDESPGSQLLMQSTLPPAVLAMFDGFLPGVLFRKAEKGPQGSLDGMEGAELTSIGEHVKRLPWQYEQTGCTIVIDRGMGGRRNLTLEDCKVHSASFAPQKGGSVKVQWTFDAPALSDDTRGKLTGLKATDIELTIALPTIEDEGQGRIGDDQDDPPATGAGSKAKLDASGKSPFPKAGAKTDAEVKAEGADTPEKALARAHGAPAATH